MSFTTPWLYQLAQRLAAPGTNKNLRREIGRLLEKLPPPGRCLDVGCGPDSVLRGFGLNPVGIDLSAARVAAFARTGCFAVQASASALPFANESFDSVWSFGLLHHLPDESARQALIEMRRVTRRGGCIIVFDGVPPRIGCKRPIAALVRRLDRGNWMRSQESLEALLVFSGDWQCRRLTYALTGLEGLLAASINL